MSKNIHVTFDSINLANYILATQKMILARNRIWGNIIGGNSPSGKNFSNHESIINLYPSISYYDKISC